MSVLRSTVSNWWDSITLREQRLVIVCSLLLVLAGIYWGIMQPMMAKADQAHSRISSEKQLLSWVVRKADKITELRGSGGNVISSMPLNQVVSTSGKSFNVELIRMQPRNEALQVWIKPMAFNRLMQWLVFLKETHGVDVEFMDLSATENQGEVEIKRLQLTRGI